MSSGKEPAKVTPAISTRRDVVFCTDVTFFLSILHPEVYDPVGTQGSNLKEGDHMLMMSGRPKLLCLIVSSRLPSKTNHVVLVA